MAHYAFLDDNNIVTEVIVGVDENQIIDGVDPETWYGNFRKQTCIRTSYNGTIRYNFAGIGYSWDGTGFAAPQPFPSWTLNSDSYLWQPPTPMPTDHKRYTWDEATTSWIEISE